MTKYGGSSIVSRGPIGNSYFQGLREICIPGITILEVVSKPESALYFLNKFRKFGLTRKGVMAEWEGKGFHSELYDNNKN